MGSHRKDVLRVQIGHDFAIRVLYCQQGGACSEDLGHEDVVLGDSTEDAYYFYSNDQKLIDQRLMDRAFQEGGEKNPYWIWFENFSMEKLTAHWLKYDTYELKAVNSDSMNVM